MCLSLSLFARRKVAKHDIKVVKVLCENRTEPKYPFTPYRECPIEFSVTQHSILIRDDWYVEVGLHSYANLKDAILAASRLFHRKYRFHCKEGNLNIVVYQAIIPKGAKYYYGKHEPHGHAYASDQLIITNEVLFQMLDSDVPIT